MITVCGDENAILEKMFELEGLGISKVSIDQTKKSANTWNNTQRKSFEGGQITAPFPLKDNIAELEDNYLVAIGRLESFQTNLKNSGEQRCW